MRVRVRAGVGVRPSRGGRLYARLLGHVEQPVRVARLGDGDAARVDELPRALAALADDADPVERRVEDLCAHAMHVRACPCACQVCRAMRACTCACQVRRGICVRGRPRLDAVVVRVGDEELALVMGDAHRAVELVPPAALPHAVPRGRRVLPHLLERVRRVRVGVRG